MTKGEYAYYLGLGTFLHNILFLILSNFSGMERSNVFFLFFKQYTPLSFYFGKLQTSRKVERPLQ